MYRCEIDALRFTNPPVFRAFLAAARLLLGLTVVGAGQAFAADPPTVNFQQQGTHLLVSGEVLVPVSPATAWTVLTDYEGIPRFVPGVRVSRVIERSGNTHVVQQQGEMQANNMRMFYFGTIRFTEEPSSRLAVHFLDGTFRNMQGKWLLEGKRAPVKLAYHLDFDTGTPYPAPAMVMMLQQQVVHWVGSLAAEMERRPKANGKASNKGKSSAP
jgi:ribosome-associated toxin RatA of RatAB toxin-antitoxin module